MKKNRVIETLALMPEEVELAIVDISHVEEDIRFKANKWDELNKKIAAIYSNNEEGDLIKIGEMAAKAFGWL